MPGGSAVSAVWPRKPDRDRRRSRAGGVAEQGTRNLLMRVVAALVLAPVAIAIAYAGGWLWTALVTLAAIGLYVEWLTIVGAARATRVVAIRCRGACDCRVVPRARTDRCLADRIDAGPGGGCMALAGAAQLDRDGIFLCCRSGGGIGAGAPRSGPGICGADPGASRGVGRPISAVISPAAALADRNSGRGSVPRRPGPARSAVLRRV